MNNFLFLFSEANFLSDLGLKVLLFFFSIFLYEKFADLFERAWIKKLSSFRKKFGSPINGLNGINPLNGLDEFSRLDQNVLQVKNKINIKFDDVAGNEQAKQELKEVVKFLKDSSSFSKLGAAIPKGILLEGPPGTGKTLLAKAVAGEAKVPFLQVSGSQFVELLIGVGAARVRDLFDQARSLKPCIIFIDEIDSLARSRSGNRMMGGANDEREQTLNQILTEMDGFQKDTGIVVIAATNRIDILDPAIRRPGRFDRQITIGNPNLKEREAILKVHARGKKLSPSLSFNQVAQRTIGFSGADLANLLNEAAILAARRKKPFITLDEISASIERLVIGLQGKELNRVKARQLTAFHEVGRAFLTELINEEDVQKITIVPRGNNSAITLTVPPSTQYNSKNLFLNKIFVTMGGRAAEDMVYGLTECTTRSQRDINQLTRILRNLILRYALSRLQPLKQQAQRRNLFLLGSDVKQELTNIIDNFTTSFADLIYQEVLSFLELVRPGGERLVDELLIFEELDGTNFKNMAKEYILALATFEILWETEESSFFSLILKKIERELKEKQIEKELQERKHRLIKGRGSLASLPLNY